MWVFAVLLGLNAFGRGNGFAEVLIWVGSLTLLQYSLFTFFQNEIFGSQGFL